ncbi:SMI1/KNR4 family protein [Massilia antarctica]|uniref:SMI1/KNR4 family protein n=1 Tax=Massilia antarctica TaxID=2765360 RepID=A0AA48W5P5_9BURK|nr:SMI1/KNR4 family protein [Massilia antarctica]QPI47471.1 SMI1/KNR4 family protein [Massilia antarctica]
MFTPNGRISEENVVDFEREIQFCVPEDYKKFLVDTNGGVLQNAMISPRRPGQLLIDCLFGLCEQSEFDLRFWLNEFTGDLPEKSLIIGSDAGGGFLLLCTEEDSAGIYYYDHSYLFSTSADEENTYLIYPSFAELHSALIK